LPLERIAVERAVSRVASGEVNGDVRANVIVAHRERDCVTLLQGRGGARIDQLFGSREKPARLGCTYRSRVGTKVHGLKKIYADGAYGGKCAVAIEQAHGISVEIVRHPGNRSTGTWQDAQQHLWPEVVAKGFVVQAKRWVVARTHAWNERARRLMAHHDRSNWAPFAWVWLAEARILATRLAT
jgi:hypothetical protein